MLVAHILLAIFLCSTPITVFYAFQLAYDREYCAIANSYAFSSTMVLMYLWPFVNPFSKQKWFDRVNEATLIWIIILTCFTEILFQIPHNLMVQQLEDSKGGIMEWPFYCYGLSDSRWSEYHGGVGLAPEVWLINFNDSILGAIVVIALLYRKYQQGSAASRITLCLAVVFRDATLWRETVEYFWDHHRKGYPYTTNGPYRQHAIVCLWLVNIIWVIAPVVSLCWAYMEMQALLSAPKRATKKIK